jgi:hypothetical protein
LRRTFFSQIKDPHDAFAEFQIKQTIPEENWDGPINDSQMINCEDRLKSFTNWHKYSTNPTPTDLAKSGFSYCNFGDKVQCFWCGIILKKWLQTDDPWCEHKKWSPNCPFIKLCKPNIDFQDEMWRYRNYPSTMCQHYNDNRCTFK